MCSTCMPPGSLHVNVPVTQPEFCNGVIHFSMFCIEEFFSRTEDETIFCAKYNMYVKVSRVTCSVREGVPHAFNSQ